MKLNYIRIFLIALLAVIFMSLLGRWEAANPSKPAVKKPVSEIQSSASVTATAKQSVVQTTGMDKVAPVATHSSAMVQDFSSASAKSITLSTNVFANLAISPINGAITDVTLKKYDVSLKDKSPLALLNTTKGSQFIAQSLLYVNNKPQAINFAQQKVDKQGDKTIVTLVGEAAGVTVTRHYTVDNNTYDITLKQTAKNTTKSPVSIVFDNQLTRYYAPEKHKSSFLGGLLNAHSFSFKGLIISSAQKPFQKVKYEDLVKSAAPITASTNTGWAAIVQHYFVSLWLPNNPGTTYSVYASKIAENTYQAGVKTQPVVLASGQMTQNTNVLYTGPTIAKNLDSMVQNFPDNAQPAGLDKLVDYGLLSFISVIVFWLMSLIHTVVGNWGVSIILVTMLIKGAFYFLSAKSYRSMAKMRLLQPRIKKYQEMYKGDRQKLGKKMMELYKEEKVNPASGCLPILIQIPVFIGLYWVLLESVQLRHSPFIFWIHDLTAKDPYFILPVLMGISMFVQQKISPTTADPTQAKIMMLMPLFFTFFFASFPSGLVLYWLTNNIVSILQQWYITKKYTAEHKAKRA